MINEKELERIQDEIKEQEKVLENIKNYNESIKHKRKWKSLLLKFRIGIPALLITGGVCIGSHSLGFGYPFKIDKLPAYRRFTIESTYDEGLTEIEDNSIVTSKDVPKLEVYYPYKKTNKGYTRKIINYHLDKDNEFRLYNAIKQKDYEYFINNLKSSSEREETVFYLPEDNSHKMIAKLSILTDMYVCELPETSNINAIVTTFNILIIILLNLISSGKYILDYKSMKREIEEEYTPIDEENVLGRIEYLRCSINDNGIGDHYVR